MRKSCRSARNSLSDSCALAPNAVKDNRIRAARSERIRRCASFIGSVSVMPFYYCGLKFQLEVKVTTLPNQLISGGYRDHLTVLPYVSPGSLHNQTDNRSVFFHRVASRFN